MLLMRVLAVRVSGSRLLLEAVEVGGKVVDRLELYQPHAK
jgi:hypothetical protein